MDLVPALGALGTFIGLVRAVPQSARLLRRKEAFGVSVDTAGTNAVVGFGWVTYGLLNQYPPGLHFVTNLMLRPEVLSSVSRTLAVSPQTGFGNSSGLSSLPPSARGNAEFPAKGSVESHRGPKGSFSG